MKPVAVLCADVHYNLNTIELADAAMRQAIDKANDLRVPLIVAGDLHDTKANLRGECVKAMIETFKRCNSPPYILVGNHCKIHEKAEEHSLEFLRPFAAIIDYLPGSALHKIGYLIPYQPDVEVLRAFLKRLPEGSQIIMHQGIQGSNAGEYYQDKSALEFNDVKDFRVISGHYHARQDIKVGRARRGAVGLFSYIGNPYTLNFGEASDPDKGYQILMSDGTLEFVPTNLRKHVIAKIIDTGDITVWGSEGNTIRPQDLVRVEVRATKEHLIKWTKEKVAEVTEITQPFKLDLIPTDTGLQTPKKELSNADLLDTLIDSTDNSEERKVRLKELWRHLGS